MVRTDNPIVHWRQVRGQLAQDLRELAQDLALQQASTLTELAPMAVIAIVALQIRGFRSSPFKIEKKNELLSA